MSLVADLKDTKLNVSLSQAHDLHLSDVTPALSFVFESSQRLFEGLNLSLHGEEYFAPIDLTLVSLSEISQVQFKLGIFWDEIALLFVLLGNSSFEKRVKSLHYLIKFFFSSSLLLDIYVIEERWSERWSLHQTLLFSCLLSQKFLLDLLCISVHGFIVLFLAAVGY